MKNYSNGRPKSFSVVRDATSQTVDAELRNDLQGFLDSRPEQVFSEFVKEIPIDRRVVNQTYLGNLARMHRWVGEKTINNISMKAFTITSEPYVQSVGLDRADLGTPGLGSQLAEQFSLAIGNYAEERAVDILQDTTTVNGYDGVPFFYDTHVLDIVNGTQSNILSGTSIVDQSTATQTISGAMERMGGWTDEQGNLKGVQPTHWFVPSALFGHASAAVADTVPNGGSNPYRGMLKIVHSPRLNGAPTTSYMYDASKGIPLFLHYVLEQPTVKYLGESSDRDFMYREHIWSAEAHSEMTMGVWHTALKITT